MAEVSELAVPIVCVCGHRYQVVLPASEEEGASFSCPACGHLCIELYAGCDAWDEESQFGCFIDLPERELLDD